MGPLHYEVGGRGPKIVLVHGFAQNRRCFGPLVAALEQAYEVVRVDAPGHGRSSGHVGDIVQGASWLAQTCGPAIYLGYSMGGRLCLRLAVDYPELVRGLVLVGATPGIEDEGARAARRLSDERWAERLERDGMEGFLDEWLAQEMFAGLDEAQHMRAERSENDPRSVAATLRLAGTGAQRSLWGQLGRITAPALIVTGANDRGFLETGDRMAQLLGPRATRLSIPNAGHAVHLQAPEAFTMALWSWLRGLSDP